MKYVTDTIVLAVGAFIALLGAAFAQDRLFEAHMWVLFFVLLASTLVMVRRISFAPAGPVRSAPDDSGYFDEVIKYGVIVVSTLPVIAIYPFLQKYFVQGVMIGAVKG